MLRLLCLSLHALFLPTLAIPPQPPVRCNNTGCLISNAYGLWGDRKECFVSTVVYPTTEEELRLAVAQANQKKLKVKGVSGFGHNIPKLACPAVASGSAMVISTSKYNSNIDVNTEEQTVTVDSGVGLRDLIDRVEEAGLSLVPAPYWEGVSIGGIVSTGSHGSSWWGKGGAVHDHVVGISVVVPAGASEGYAKILRIGPRDPLFNAARVSLGLLGVVSRITLSLEPGFKRSITYSFQDDGGLEDAFMGHAQSHEFGDITWYPSKHQAVYRHDDRVPLNTSGDGINDFVGFQSTSILVYSGVRATGASITLPKNCVLNHQFLNEHCNSEKGLESAKNVKGKCTMASSTIGYKKLIANGLKNNNLIFTGYPVVGHQGRMQTSGACHHSPATDITSSCAWDPRYKGLRFYETTAIFPASKFRDFIVEVKKLRDLQPDNFCGVDVYNGLLIRFIKASGAYLGVSEDSVVVDFNYYRADEPLTPRLHQDVWEEVEQMAFFKYGAKPHWGKNRNAAFLGMQGKYPNFGKFMASKRLLDPQGIFSNDWLDEVLLGKESDKEDGCAMEGQCICSEDKHCNPGKQYLCKPGLVYTKARVCRDGRMNKI